MAVVKYSGLGMSVIYSGTSNNYRVRGCNATSDRIDVTRRVVNLRTAPSPSCVPSIMRDATISHGFIIFSPNF